MVITRQPQFIALYPLFDMDKYVSCVNTALRSNDSANDALHVFACDFANEILGHKAFKQDYLVPFIKEALNFHDSSSQTTIDDILYDTLVYIFEERIGVDIVEAIFRKDVKHLLLETKFDEDVDAFLSHNQWDYLEWSQPYNELLAEIKDSMTNESRPSPLVECLAKQIALDIGDTFTIDGYAGKFTLTKDGIISNGRLIDQQQLLYILYSDREIRKDD